MKPDPINTPLRAYRGESAEDRRLQRRDKLMEAAFDSFAHHGIAKTTMRDICTAARLTDRYFYEVFRNTEDAFDAVHQWQREQLVSRIGTALLDMPKDMAQLARAGLGAFYGFIKEDPRRAQVLLIDAFSANQQSVEKSQMAVHEYVTLMSNYAHILFPKIKPGFNMEMLLWGLVGMAIQVGTYWARNGFKEPIEDVLAYNLYAWRGLDLWTAELTAQAREASKSAQQADGGKRGALKTGRAKKPSGA
ncbi:MAG: TetR/AcrR family transcriptional regulator [Aquabacterium sp.]